MQRISLKSSAISSLKELRSACFTNLLYPLIEFKPSLSAGQEEVEKFVLLFKDWYGVENITKWYPHMYLDKSQKIFG